MRQISRAIALVGFLTLGACEVQQTEEGQLPDVDVNSSGAELPEFQAETTDVDVDTKQTEVTVPTVETGEEANQPQ